MTNDTERRRYLKQVAKQRLEAKRERQQRIALCTGKQRACDHKRRLRSIQHALRVATEQYRLSGLEFTVYPCPFCGKWHLSRAKK